MKNKNQSYWKSNLKVVFSLLLVWFIASYGFGIIFSNFLDQIKIGGFKLGFWFAQQGSIFVFVILIFVYVWLMKKLDKNILKKNDEHPSPHLYICGCYFCTLHIGIAIWSKAKSTNDFYVAGKGVHPVANGMATAADWMSAASFLSMAGLIAFLGKDGSVYLMGWTGGYVLLALLLAPYLRKFGKFTVPDFIGERYYSKTARKIAVLCLIFISFTYIAGQMRGVGIVFSRFLEVDITTGVIVGMAIVFFYAVLGGMKGITYTQVAQYCVLIFAYLVPAIFISILMTGEIIPQIGFGSKLVDSPTYLLDKLDQVTKGPWICCLY